MLKQFKKAWSYNSKDSPFSCLSLLKRLILVRCGCACVTNKSRQSWTEKQKEIKMENTDYDDDVGVENFVGLIVAMVILSFSCCAVILLCIFSQKCRDSRKQCTMKQEEVPNYDGPTYGVDDHIVDVVEEKKL